MLARPSARDEGGLNTHQVIGISSLGLAGASALGAIAFEVSARALRAADQPSQQRAEVLNQRIESRNQIATGLCVGAVVAGIVGTAALLWPDAQSSRLRAASSGLNASLRF